MLRKGGEVPQSFSSFIIAPSDLGSDPVLSTRKLFLFFIVRADPAGRSSGTRSLLEELAENSAQMLVIWPMEKTIRGSIENEELFEDIEEDIICIC